MDAQRPVPSDQRPLHQSKLLNHKIKLDMKYLLLPLLLLIAGCSGREERADAYGNFEAREVIVSSEVPGRIVRLDVEEGGAIEAGQVVGLIDTTALDLRREQLVASIGAVRDKTRDAQPDVEVLEEQRRNLLREQARIEALLRDKAATPKQLDDITGQIDVVERQIVAARAQTRTTNRGILAEVDPLRAQIRQVEDQIRKSYIVNPIDGVVLLQLAEPAEVIQPGQPLYKIAELDELFLRAYVSGVQLPDIRLGQPVTVLVDEDEENYRSYSGTITWISDKAEFTPKIVQTKEERINLVYAVKIKVPNDGRLKVGMPGEVVFEEQRSEAGAGQTVGN